MCYNNGNRNNKKEGKRIMNYNSGNRIKDNGKIERKKEKEYFIFYYKNGDREMRDYLNDKKVGKYVIHSVNGKASSQNY